MSRKKSKGDKDYSQKDAAKDTGSSVDEINKAWNDARNSASNDASKEERLSSKKRRNNTKNRKLFF